MAKGTYLDRFPRPGRPPRNTLIGGPSGESAFAFFALRRFRLGPTFGGGVNLSHRHCSCHRHGPPSGWSSVRKCPQVQNSCMNEIESHVRERPLLTLGGTSPVAAGRSPLFQLGDQMASPSTGSPMAAGFSMIPIGVLRDPHLSIGARLLWSLLKSYAWADGFTDVTLERLSRDIGKGGSVRNVKRWMGELEGAHLIQRERRRRPKGETWEATRTWLLVDVVDGRAVRRQPRATPGPRGPERGTSEGPSVARGGEPGAIPGPWISKWPGESQGPPMAHNVDASLDASTYRSDADPEVRPLLVSAQASPPAVGSASTSGEPRSPMLGQSGQGPPGPCEVCGRSSFAWFANRALCPVHRA